MLKPPAEPYRPAGPRPRVDYGVMFILVLATIGFFWFVTHICASVINLFR